MIHADWSVHPYKRQMAAAWLQPDGSYIAHAPISVPNPGHLLPELRAMIGPSGCALVGFDFPIGLPHAYAQKVGITDFLSALPNFEQGEWENFYHAAEAPSEISLHRPFYPARPGNASQSHLLAALGFQDMNSLRRVCELAYPGRRAAAPLFWTLGGQQVGKAAVSGWRDVLTPALRTDSEHFRIWPFNGQLEALLQPGRIVAAETYPAEFYPALDVVFTPPKRSLKSGKRSITDRQTNASNLLRSANKLNVHVSSELEKTIQAGFGSSLQAEDAFDAVIGLLGMFLVVRGKRPHDTPLPSTVSAVEGWILGQEASRSVD
jgi:hypothetical protein